MEKYTLLLVLFKRRPMVSLPLSHKVVQSAPVPFTHPQLCRFLKKARLPFQGLLSTGLFAGQPHEETAQERGHKWWCLIENVAKKSQIRAVHGAAVEWELSRLCSCMVVVGRPFTTEA